MVRDEILFGLLKFNILSKTALHVLSSAPSTIDRPLLTLSGKGLIKEYTVYEKDKINKKAVIFYTLTTFGIRAVKNSDEITKLHPWVERIPLFKTDEDFFQFRNSEAEILLRYLKQTEISFMAQSLGYEVPPMSFHKSGNLLSLQDISLGETPIPLALIPPEKRTFGDEVSLAYLLREEEKGDIEYVPSTEVKRNILDKTLNPADVGTQEWISSSRDTITDRYAGLFATDSEALLVYSAPNFGIRWSSDRVAREKNALKSWAVLNGKKQDDSRAAIIIRNPAHLSYLFNDKKGMRLIKSKTDSDNEPGKKSEPVYISTELGDGYERFYSIPVSSDGCLLLDAILNGKIEEYKKSLEEQMNRSLEESGMEKLKVNDGSKLDRNLFPYYFEKEDTYLMNLADMDLRKLYVLSDLANNENIKLNLGLICCTWQREYFNILVPKTVGILYPPAQKRKTREEYYASLRGKKREKKE